MLWTILSFLKTGSISTENFFFYFFKFTTEGCLTYMYIINIATLSSGSPWQITETFVTCKDNMNSISPKAYEQKKMNKCIIK